MKKRVLLSLLIVSVLACLFTITASAAVTTYKDAPARENIEIRKDDVVVFDDGFTCPSAYVFKDSTTTKDGSNWNLNLPLSMDFSFINEKTGKSYAFANIVELDIPQGITYLCKYAFYKCNTIKKVSIPDSVTTIGDCAFENASSLEECVFEHKESSGLTTFPGYMFSNATSLKALSIPDCVTTMTGHRVLAGCTNLTAVYLSKSLTGILGCESNRGDHATFDGNSKMYFVNEAFTYDNIPEKPAVYYFPANFQSFANNCLFRNNSALNETIVFGDELTSIPNTYNFERTGNKTMVFLGDMENVTAKNWSTTTIYFANKADKSASDIATLTGSQAKYYCNAEGNTNHLAEKTVDVPAQCEIDAGKVTYCFCGHEISKVPVEGTALSHDYDYVNNENAKLIKIEYSDYAKVGTKTVACALCGKENGVEAEALFTFKGYSTDNENQICVGYLINQKAIDEYKANGGAGFSYGFVASANNNTPLALTDKTVNIDLTLEKYSALDFKISGEWSDSNQSTALLSMNIYTKLGENISYVYGYKNEAGDIVSQSYKVADQVSYSSMNP